MSRIKTFFIILFFSVLGIELSMWALHDAISPTTLRSLSFQNVIQQIFSPPSPSRLVIPTLGVDANVEAVTVDNQNRMAVPRDIYDVGWYSLGVKPGQTGNAVIDGHYNTPTGAPNVFYNLDQLQKGDTIQIVDASNNTLTFSVTQTVDYPLDAVPLDNIFGPSSKQQLILITCSGVWNHAAHNYSDRTVVYAELK